MDDKTIELAFTNIGLVLGGRLRNVHKRILLAHARYKYDALKNDMEAKEQKNTK